MCLVYWEAPADPSSCYSAPRSPWHGILRPMKIATWNLERGPSRKAERAQKSVLDALAADIVVLTEPPTDCRTSHSVVTSPPHRHGRHGPESWVAIQGKSALNAVEIDIPYERMAVAARAKVDGRQVIIYGTVLPWNAIRRHAPELVQAGESASDAFSRVLREQVADILELRRRHRPDLILWAGDFNQSVRGANYGGSQANRKMLTDALDALGFEAWNGKADHAEAGLCAIDLICGVRDQPLAHQGRIDPVAAGKVQMSDHAGYWVEI